MNQDRKITLGDLRNQVIMYLYNKIENKLVLNTEDVKLDNIVIKINPYFDMLLHLTHIKILNHYS